LESVLPARLPLAQLRFKYGNVPSLVRAESGAFETFTPP